MKKVKKSAYVFMLVVVALLGMTMFACGKDDTPVQTEWPETGIYYYAADSGDTYYVTLSNKSYVWMQLGSNGSYAGTYTLKDGKFEFSLSPSASITAEYKNDEVVLTYNSRAMRFMRSVSYTVSYESNGGSAVTADMVRNGDTLRRPADPVRDGYVFVGWYTDDAFTTPFDFDAKPVTADTKLYARWSDKLAGISEYTVSFDLNYQTEEKIAPIDTKGGKAYLLPTPTREGYTFCGWWVSDYESADKLTYKYNENILQADTTLFAVWDQTGTSVLATPMPQVVGDTVTWDAVDGMSAYQVKVVGPKGNALVDRRMGGTNVSVPFSDATSDEGEYTITVQAIAPNPNNNSAVATRYFNNKALARVSQFSVIDPSVLLYGSVEGAEKYTVKVECGNPSHNHTAFDNGLSTYFSFANCEMTENGIAFTVTASAAGRASSVSKTFYYNRVLDKIDALYFDEETETLRWNAVPNAADYVVKISAGGGTQTLSTAGATSVSLRSYVGAQIAVSVTPVTSGYNSPEASKHTYTRNRLNAPTALKITNTELSWNAVQGATSYTVLVDGNEYAGINDTKYDLKNVSLTTDIAYQLQVRAVGSTSSVWSDPITAQFYSMSESVVYESNTLTWRPVIGAATYRVRVNGGAIKSVDAGVNSTSVTLTQKGNNTVSVSYVDDGGTASAWVNINVYAYEVMFDPREGSELSTAYLAIGDTLRVPEITRDGYILSGWYNVPGAAQANGKLVESGTRFTTVGDVILYAGWTPRPYTITLVPGTSTLTGDKTYSVVVGDSYHVAVPTINDTAMTFVGWYSEQEGKGTQYTDSEGYSIATWQESNNVQMYPHWVALFKFEEVTSEIDNGTYSVKVTTEAAHATKIVIPETYNGKKVTMVEGRAFNNFANIRVIEIPDTIHRIVDVSAFEGCSSLEEIKIYETGHAVSPLYTSEGGALYYTSDITNDGKTLVYVPAALKGNLVIASDAKVIGAEAFRDATLTGVTIPSSVSVFAERAFAGCATLSEINFDMDEGDELIVGDEAFDGCTGLKDLYIPARFETFETSIFGSSTSLENIHVAKDHKKYSSQNGLLANKAGNTIVYCPTARRGIVTIPLGVTTIGEGAFAKCTKITSVVIPNFVTKIESGAFSGCTKLTTVTFTGSNSLGDALEIGTSAFSNCTALTQVDFQANSNVTKIKGNVFAGCDRLTSLTLSATIQTVESTALSSCRNLVNVYVDPASNYFSSQDGVLFDKKAETLIFYAVSRKAEAYTVPATVKTIGAGVFSTNKALKKVVIGNKIENIGEKAFYQASNLQMVVFLTGAAASTKLIVETSAFEGCSSLQHLYLAASENSATTTYTDGTPSSLRTLGDRALYGTNITNLVLSEGVEVLGDRVFGEMKFTSLALPASVKTIKDYCFWLCRGLTSVTVPQTGSHLETIGTQAFYGCDLDGFYIPKSVTEIANYAFSGSLENGVTFETRGADDPIIKLGSSLFSGSKLTEIEFPKDKCKVTWKVWVPPYINDRFPEWNRPGYWRLSTTLDGAMYLAKVENMPQDDTYMWEGGALYEKDKTITDKEVPVTLVSTLLEEKDYVVPYTVTKIDEGYCGKSMSFEATPAGVEELPLTLSTGAFNNSRIKKVTFPARLVQMGEDIKVERNAENDGMFAYASTQEIVFEDSAENPSQLTAIPNYTFCYMRTTSLSITFPSTVKRIGHYAFEPGYSGSYPLSSIVFPENLEFIGEYCFANNSGNGASFSEISIPATVKYIGTNAFANNSKLTKVTFEKDANGDCALVILGGGAFRNASITEIKLPKSLAGSAYLSEDAGDDDDDDDDDWDFDESPEILESGTPDGKLGDGMFYNCRKLTTVEFEGDCPEIKAYGKNVFGNCTVYSEVTFPKNLGKIDTWGQGNTITKITIPATFGASDITNIVPSLSSVTQFALAPNNKNLMQDTNGGIYTADGKKLLYYPSNLTATTYTLLPTTEEIGDYAFYENKYLETVVLNGKVTEEVEEEGETVTKTKYVGLQSIGQYAFAVSSASAKTTALKTITIPESVKEIGDYAFYGCGKLTTVNFVTNTDGDSALTDIGKEAFRECISLTQIVLPNNVTKLGYDWGEWWYDMPSECASVFYGCSSLTSVTLPKNLTYICAQTFAECPKLTTLVILEGSALQSITPYAFHDSGLTAVDFTNAKALTHIGEYSFYNNHITSLTLGASVRNIGNYAFANSNIAALKLNAALTKIENYAFYNNPAMAKLEVAENCRLTHIGDYAFCKTGLTKVELTNAASLNTVGDYAFNELSLTSIALPNSVTYIGNYAFYGCSGVASLSLPASIETIGDYAFAKTGITSLHVYGNNTEIGKGAFAECGNLITLELESGVDSIGSSAFAYTGITSVVLPDTITSLDGNPFAGCALSNIEVQAKGADIKFVSGQLLNGDGTILYYTTPAAVGAMELDENITAIMPGAFAGSQITSITLPDSITVIEEGTFQNCKQLESIEIGINVTRIGDFAFENCTALSSVTFAVGGTEAVSIGDRAFYNCTSLTSIVLPHRLRNYVIVDEVYDEWWDEWEEATYGKPGIGESSFEKSGLQSVTFESADSISDEISTAGYYDMALMIGTAAFRDCKNLETIVLPTHFSQSSYDQNWIDGQWYDSHNLDGRTPDLIGSYAFAGCAKLAFAKLSDDVTAEEGYDAETFKGLVLPVNSGLSSHEDGYLNYGSSVGAYAFQGVSLGDFTAPIYLNVFTSHSFAESGLTKFTMPKYVRKASYIGEDDEEIEGWIAESAFENCKQLTEFVFESNLGSLSHPRRPELGKNAFRGCTALKTATFVDMYVVLEGAFEGCTALETVSMNFLDHCHNGQVMRIEQNAFAGCSTLKNVTITGDLECIEANAFKNCTSVTSITIPHTVLTVSASAFAGWTSGQTIVVPYAEGGKPGGWADGFNGGATIQYTAASATQE